MNNESNEIWTKDNIHEFVNYHNSKYIDYCEILISNDGSIQYAIPSHQLKLMELYGVPRDQLYDNKGKEYNELLNTIPLSANPTYWLGDYMNCTIVWYNMVLFPFNYTKDQIDVVNILKDNNILSDDISLDIIKEYHHFSIIEDPEIKDIKSSIDNLYEETKNKLNIIIKNILV
jgi:hypothetical protein